MDWGHLGGCQCILCKTLHRVHSLVKDNSRHFGFVPFAAQLLRQVESQIRDEAPLFAAQGSQLAPNILGPPLVAGSAPQAPGQASPAEEGKGAEENSQGRSLTPGTTAKVVGAVPPASLVPVKSEEEASSPKKSHQGVEDLCESHPEERKAKKEKKQRKTSRSRSRRRRRESRHSERGDRRSPSKKEERLEKETEPEERESREEIERKPKPPNFPPPSSGSRPAQGSGWRGPVPYSNHPRWSTSKNKGIVKRAKQELYNSRHAWRR